MPPSKRPVLSHSHGNGNGSPRGAQCPSCFTFNLLDHLPATKKRPLDGANWDLQCALCGHEYPLLPHSAPAAA